MSRPLSHIEERTADGTRLSAHIFATGSIYEIRVQEDGQPGVAYRSRYATTPRQAARKAARMIRAALIESERREEARSRTLRAREDRAEAERYMR